MGRGLRRPLFCLDLTEDVSVVGVASSVGDVGDMGDSEADDGEIGVLLVDGESSSV